MKIVIAEIGANHLNSVLWGEKLLVRLKNQGITWVKFQLWNVDEMWQVPPRDVVPPEPHIVLELIQAAKGMGLKAGCAVTTPAWLKLLKKSDPDFIKLPSFSVGREDLQKAFRKRSVPGFFGTGFVARYRLPWLREALGHAIPLICSSKYPSSVRDYELPEDLPGTWGVSDHTRGFGLCALAATRGASFFEKHVWLGEGARTRDAGPHVMSPSEVGVLQETLNDMEDATRPCEPFSPPPIRMVSPVL